MNKRRDLQSAPRDPLINRETKSEAMCQRLSLAFPQPGNLLLGAGASAAAGLLGAPAMAQARSKAVLAYGSTGYTWALP